MVYAERQELLYWIKQVACQIHYSFASKCPVADVWEKNMKEHQFCFSSTQNHSLQLCYVSFMSFSSYFVIQMLE